MVFMKTRESRIVAAARAMRRPIKFFGGQILDAVKLEHDCQQNRGCDCNAVTAPAASSRGWLRTCVRRSSSRHKTNQNDSDLPPPCPCRRTDPSKIYPFESRR